MRFCLNLVAACAGQRPTAEEPTPAVRRVRATGKLTSRVPSFMRPGNSCSGMATVTLLIWSNIDLVEGHMLHLTNRDQSRTFVSIFMHENNLYVGEAAVSPGYPEPGLFQQSLAWIDENGNGIRCQSLYRNGFPVPSRAR
jgi:hypothetical protein